MKYILREAKDIPTVQVLAEAKVPERLVSMKNKYSKNMRGWPYESSNFSRWAGDKIE